MSSCYTRSQETLASELHFQLSVANADWRSYSLNHQEAQLPDMPRTRSQSTGAKDADSPEVSRDQAGADLGAPCKLHSRDAAVVCRASIQATRRSVKAQIRARQATRPQCSSCKQQATGVVTANAVTML